MLARLRSGMMREDNQAECRDSSTIQDFLARARSWCSNWKVLVGILIVIVLCSVGAVMAWQAASAPLLSGENLPAEDREKKAGADTSSVIDDTPGEGLGIPSKTAADPRFAFLLLGYGGGGHEGGYLTDSIVVAIANPSQKTLTLLSLPRDCWVPQLFDGDTAVYNKLNTAYAFAKDASLYTDRIPRYTGDHGAGRFASDTVSRLLGIPISNYLSLDFDGFRQMIDAVGGVDVNVPNSFSARYPANDDPSIDPRWIVVRFEEGEECMNGERAIQYVRAREVIDNPSESGDFARSRRQRLVMEAFKTRLFEPSGLIHVPQLIAISAQHIDTDYAIPDVGQFGQFILDWKDVDIYQTALTLGNYLTEATGPGGAYVVVPDGPDQSWAQIQAFARCLWENPATGVAMANTRLVIINGTGESGVATRLSETLTKMGYRVGEPVTGEKSRQSRLVDRTGGRAKPLVEKLVRDLGLSFIEVAQTEEDEADELVLELGFDDIGLANISAPTVDPAPTSAVGIEVFGRWSPNVAPVVTFTSRIPTPSPSPGPPVTSVPTAWPTSTPLETTATPMSSATRTPAPATVTPTAMPRLGSPTATPIPIETSTPIRTVEPTVTPTETAMPANTPIPTETPTPTQTVEPTATPNETLTPTRDGTEDGAQ